MRGRFFFSGGGLVGLGTTGQLLRSGWFCPLKLLEKERSAAVRFTRLIQGGVEAGPKTVLALAPQGDRKTDPNLRVLAGVAVFVVFGKFLASPDA